MADHWAREAANLLPASALEAFRSFRADTLCISASKAAVAGLLRTVWDAFPLFSSLSHTPSASAGGSQTLDRPA